MPTTARPIQETVLEPTETRDGGYVLVIYNNETNSFEDVIRIIMLATQCDLQEAYIETWEAHTYGVASVHFGSKEVCEKAGQVIASIGVRTEVRREWHD